MMCVNPRVETGKCFGISDLGVTETFDISLAHSLTDDWAYLWFQGFVAPWSVYLSSDLHFILAKSLM